MSSALFLKGETGIGKSTLMNTLFNTTFENEEASHYENKVQLRPQTYDLQESNVNLKLTIVHTVGFGDQINKEERYRFLEVFVWAGCSLLKYLIKLVPVIFKSLWFNEHAIENYVISSNCASVPSGAMIQYEIEMWPVSGMWIEWREREFGMTFSIDIWELQQHGIINA